MQRAVQLVLVQAGETATVILDIEGPSMDLEGLSAASQDVRFTFCGMVIL